MMCQTLFQAFYIFQFILFSQHSFDYFHKATEKLVTAVNTQLISSGGEVWTQEIEFQKLDAYPLYHTQRTIVVCLSL